MQIAPLKTSTGAATGSTGSIACNGASDADTSAGTSTSGTSGTSAADQADLVRVRSAQAAALKGAAADAAPASTTQRGLRAWDPQLQADIASAQQALDFLDKSAAQLQALKSELASKLSSRQSKNREGQVEARLRQFSNTWRERQAASGGTLDSQLDYSASTPAVQRFTIRGLNLANLQSGSKEVLAFSVGGASQALSSVSIEPGMGADEIVQRFDQALAPANIRVSAGDDGALVFSTPEKSWGTVRDTLAVRGSGIRFPTGQMNRVKTDEVPATIAPDSWGSNDTEALRQSLQQVVQALAQIQLARANVSRELEGAGIRVESAQPAPLAVAGADPAAGMDQLAQNFATIAKQPDYESLLAITSALSGISRERVQSLLALT
jgi:hypothetical protein